MVGIFFPTLGVLLHAPYVLEVAAAWVSLEVTASIGFFEFFLLIFNKRTMRLIVSIYRQRKDKYLRRKERLPSYMRRAHSLLAEINHSDLQFDDGGMLGNMFENATKIVRFI